MYICHDSLIFNVPTALYSHELPNCSNYISRIRSGKRWITYLTLQFANSHLIFLANARVLSSDVSRTFVKAGRPWLGCAFSKLGCVRLTRRTFSDGRTDSVVFRLVGIYNRRDGDKWEDVCKWGQMFGEEKSGFRVHFEGISERRDCLETNPASLSLQENFCDTTRGTLD